MVGLNFGKIGVVDYVAFNIGNENRVPRRIIKMETWWLIIHNKKIRRYLTLTLWFVTIERDLFTNCAPFSLTLMWWITIQIS
jgi:hypothetical protein